MKPLSFAVAPPRGPRVALASIVYSARVIDKLRAALPGGELNGFLPFDGFSLLWAHYTQIDLYELFDVIVNAEDEDEIIAWIATRTQSIDTAKINTKMENFSTDRISDEMRAHFDAIYPRELRERFTNLFDLLEADDQRLYATQTS